MFGKLYAMRGAISESLLQNNPSKRFNIIGTGGGGNVEKLARPLAGMEWPRRVSLHIPATICGTTTKTYSHGQPMSNPRVQDGGKRKIL